MMRKITGIAIAALVMLSLPTESRSHCQVPCGIYDDAARVTRMYEDAATIEKAIGQINQLAGKTDAQSANQLGRWIATKEAHATNIITTVAEYFLTQKVKPVAADADGYSAYLAKLADHHQVMNAAMKAKQNADAQYASALKDAIAGLAQHYDTAGHDH
jgi:nickel superoxide dismutase